MARTGPNQKLAAAVAGILIAGLLAAGGEEAAPPAPPTGTTPVPAPLSPDCQGGTTEIVTASPLPNVTAALQKRRTIRILAIGASAGRRQGGYTSRIEQILKHVLKGIDIVMINRGVSGELAADAALRIKTEVAISSPDLVIWQVGTNDALAFVPLEEIATAVETTIRWLKEHNVDIVLAGLQYVERVSQDEHYYRVRELLREIAAKENVMIIRRYEAMQFIAATQEAGGGHGPDEFERTEAGYNCLAQYLASAITLGAFGRGIGKRPLRSQEKAQK
jgi:lysophospholipase L1-like esterase